MSFFSELKRRNVFRVALLYMVASWLIMQVADVVMPRVGIDNAEVVRPAHAGAVCVTPSPHNNERRVGCKEKN